jgi:hypothetical protein
MFLKKDSNEDKGACHAIIVSNVGRSDFLVTAMKNFPLHSVFHLSSVPIAALYALLAFGNCLLYWQGSPLEVLGFSDDPIGWWAIATILFTIAFSILTIKLVRQGCFHGANPNQQQHSRRQPTVMLVTLTILFALPNLFIAFLHLTMGIPSGFLYWGQVRAAYEVPFFHLLPMLLLLYWWLSSYYWRRQAHKE